MASVWSAKKLAKETKKRGKGEPFEKEIHVLEEAVVFKNKQPYFGDSNIKFVGLGGRPSNVTFEFCKLYNTLGINADKIYCRKGVRPVSGFCTLDFNENVSFAYFNNVKGTSAISLKADKVMVTLIEGDEVGVVEFNGDGLFAENAELCQIKGNIGRVFAENCPVLKDFGSAKDITISGECAEEIVANEAEKITLQRVKRVDISKIQRPEGCQILVLN